MLDMGMVDGLAQFFDPEANDLEDDSEHRVGLRKAIGVAEFDRYFKQYPPSPGGLRREEDRMGKATYEEAVRAIKENTCRLAKRQIGKILRLKGAGWDLQRLDATKAIRAAMTPSKCSDDGGERWSDIWERRTGGRTKREDCEEVLEGVGLPAKSSYFNSNFMFHSLSLSLSPSNFFKK